MQRFSDTIKMGLTHQDAKSPLSMRVSVAHALAPTKDGLIARRENSELRRPVETRPWAARPKVRIAQGRVRSRHRLAQGAAGCQTQGRDLDAPARVPQTSARVSLAERRAYEWRASESGCHVVPYWACAQIRSNETAHAVRNITRQDFEVYLPLCRPSRRSTKVVPLFVGYLF
jgi:hypothetical protein